MSKDSDSNRQRRELHRKLDLILDSACRQVASTVRFTIEASYKLVRAKRRK